MLWSTNVKSAYTALAIWWLSHAESTCLAVTIRLTDDVEKFLVYSLGQSSRGNALFLEVPEFHYRTVYDRWKKASSIPQTSWIHKAFWYWLVSDKQKQTQMYIRRQLIPCHVGKDMWLRVYIICNFHLVHYATSIVLPIAHTQTVERLGF